LFELQTNSSEETEAVAEKIGKVCKGGEVIELISDLGGGKTTFARGLARGIGSTGVVSSPTFTISKVYAGPKLKMYHFDFYRLDDAGLMAHELHDAIDDPVGVIAVEWGEVVSQVLPDKRLTVSITPSGEDVRQLTIRCPEPLSYLMEGVK
jgi:tRNA threonylcarbamoyladenosine biosynthesis protein TsaE